MIGDGLTIQQRCRWSTKYRKVLYSKLQINNYLRSTCLLASFGSRQGISVLSPRLQVQSSPLHFSSISSFNSFASPLSCKKIPFLHMIAICISYQKQQPKSVSHQ